MFEIDVVAELKTFLSPNDAKPTNAPQNKSISPQPMIENINANKRALYFFVTVNGSMGSSDCPSESSRHFSASRQQIREKSPPKPPTLENLDQAVGKI